ncbi:MULTISPECIES: hypothetical protein [Anaerotruncus]|jgi:hypothetical protein|uniref:hypothetical protein n=3 Tax=Oscillospiraceae TaxID=216572 RepID=UPI000837250C|nr:MULTISPECIES: hypothetical protein [Anaerotruncus]RGX52497.1 hypothetical protein DWV16_18055 [Anaerotruncus sp. AF02-27]
MWKKLVSCTCALMCACLIPTVSFAADGTPVLSGESEACALTKIYYYQPLSDGGSGNYSIRSDSVYCTVTERITDDGGDCYRVADSTPLSDTSLFRRKSEINIGANYVRQISATDRENENATGSNFCLKLTKDYSGQDTVIEFQNTYTALQDATLQVYSAANPKDLREMTIRKGAQFTAVSRISLNDRTTSVSNYPVETLKDARGTK